MTERSDMLDRPMFFDRQGNPLDSAAANRLLGDTDYKRVARTEITSSSDPAVSFDVSTVWLGVNHNFNDDGPPIIFETMVFGGDEDQDQIMWRWSTEAEARAGHAEVVTSIAATVPDEQISDTANGQTETAETTVGLHLHQWTEWQDAEATYDSPLFPKLGTWKVPVQVRRCLKCKKSQTRKIA
ncbi:hypothetical protein [Streptomyces sp. NPDC059928]|uniref:hypothetical protein n=1 Tax=unclassified Streptomyces TaxID=2593676 RepID=UPI003649A63C